MPPDSYQDPFEEYKKRQEKRRANKAEAEENAKLGRVAEAKKEGDDVNWFGVKVGHAKSILGSDGGGGVGKYLGSGAATAPKRPLVPAIASDVPDIPQKKRKIGFGSFDNW